MAARRRRVLEHHQPPGRIELVRRFDPVVPRHRPPHRRRFVRDSIAAGHRPAEASAELLDRAARETIGRALQVSGPDLRAMLDARRFLDTRLSEGGVAPERVRSTWRRWA